jgi:hypothetical protein
MTVRKYDSTGLLIADNAVTYADSPNIDAFGRLRVAAPQTLFDSKQVYDNEPLLWDESLESGAGISSSHSTDTASTTITSTLNTAGTFTRQTFRRFNYQPGKSQLIMMTGILERSGGGTGVERRIGIFDDDNGYFFADNEGTPQVVRRTNVTGTPVDNEVSSWNTDKLDGNGPSGVTVDWTKTQIFFIDFEWLGVGRARMGIIVDGQMIVAHTFDGSNSLDKVVFSTPNLPLRYQMITTGSSPASTMEAICGTVVSEGGVQDTGVIRNASTAGTQVDMTTEDQLYAVIGIRLKSTHLGCTVKLLKLAMSLQSASDEIEWVLFFDPSIAGSPSWSSITNSCCEYFTGATANTISGGTQLDAGYLTTGTITAGSGGAIQPLENALLLGAAIDGTQQTIVLSARPIAGSATNVLVEGGLTWRELS